jgi:hypothetical protein
MNRDDGVILNEILDTSKPEAQEIALECNLMLNESSDYLPTHPSSFPYSYSSYSSSSAGAIELSAEHYGGGGMSFLSVFYQMYDSEKNMNILAEVKRPPRRLVVELPRICPPARQIFFYWILTQILVHF